MKKAAKPPRRGSEGTTSVRLSMKRATLTMRRMTKRRATTFASDASARASMRLSTRKNRARREGRAV